MSSTAPRRIAVVGSGVAGLTAAYVASRTAHVTLFEADDRLGGHADTHVVPTRRRRPAHRHRLHRPQPAHLPDAAAALRRARHRDPAVGDVAVGLRPGHRGRVRRGPRRPRPLPDPRGRHLPDALADAGRDPALPPPRQGRPDRLVGDRGHLRRRPRPDPARLPRRGRLQRPLRAPLHGAPGGGRLVLRPGDVPRLPGPLPVHVPRAPRHARHLRLARVAHRHRRLGHLRRRRRGAAAGDPARHQGHVRGRDHPRRRRDGRQRRHLVVRRRRDRHAPVAGAEHARVPDRAPARGPRRDPLLAQHRPAAHRHLAAAGREGRAVVVELPAPGRRDRCGDRDLRPHPPAAAAHRHALPRHPRRRAPRRPGHRDRPDGVRAPALHPRVRRRPGAAAGDRHRPDRLRRGLPRLGLPRGRRALRAGRGHPARAAVGAPRARPRPSGPAASRPRSGTRVVRRSRAASSTARPSGSSTSTTCPTTACSPASRRATTSATPAGRCAATSSRSSPTTASRSVPEPAPAGS